MLGHFPTGVTVVTAVNDGAPAGLAVGSFASVSLDPPLVAFFPGRSSTSWPQIQEAGTSASTSSASTRRTSAASSPAGDRTSSRRSAGSAGRTGAPILNDVIGWIECEIERVDDAGDHYFVLGRVIDLDVEHEGGPLIFFRGGYGRYEV